MAAESQAEPAETASGSETSAQVLRLLAAVSWADHVAETNQGRPAAVAEDTAAASVPVVEEPIQQAQLPWVSHTAAGLSHTGPEAVAEQHILADGQVARLGVLKGLLYDPLLRTCSTCQGPLVRA